MKNALKLLSRHIVLLLAAIFAYNISFAQSAAIKDSITPSGKHIYYGTASYYAEKFHGRKTFTGETFSQHKMTCASNVIKIGTTIKVTNLKNDKTIIVKVNDKMHHRNKRLIDLTYTAAKKLGFIQQGITKVKVEEVSKKDKS